MKPRRLTVSDLCKVSEYSRHQMRGLLAELPLYAQRAGEVRVAAEFGAHDLLVITVCCRLESRYGLRRATVVALSKDLARALTGPRPLARGARLVLQFDPPSVRYVEALDDVDEGLVMPLGPVFSLVDGYLLPGALNSSGRQRELGVSAPVQSGSQRGPMRSTHNQAPSPLGKKKAVPR